VPWNAPFDEFTGRYKEDEEGYSIPEVIPRNTTHLDVPQETPGDSQWVDRLQHLTGLIHAQILDSGIGVTIDPNHTPTSEQWRAIRDLQDTTRNEQFDGSVIHKGKADKRGNADSIRKLENLVYTKPPEEELYQGMPANPKGAVQFLNDHRAIIHAFAKADVSTAIHETAHIWRRTLNAADTAVTEAWAGVKDGKWTRDAEEKLARAVERYAMDGKAPTTGLKPVFEKFKQWLSDIYGSIKGSPLEVDISPEMKALLDRHFSGGEEPPRATKTTTRANEPSTNAGGSSDPQPPKKNGAGDTATDRVSAVYPSASPGFREAMRDPRTVSHLVTTTGQLTFLNRSRPGYDNQGRPIVPNKIAQVVDVVGRPAWNNGRTLA